LLPRLGCLEVVRCCAVCDEVRLWREPDGFRAGAGSPLAGLRAGSRSGLGAASPLDGWRVDGARPVSPSARADRLRAPRDFGGAGRRQ
jgi:hypothetical protein